MKEPETTVTNEDSFEHQSDVSMKRVEGAKKEFGVDSFRFKLVAAYYLGWFSGYPCPEGSAKLKAALSGQLEGYLK